MASCVDALFLRATLYRSKVSLDRRERLKKLQIFLFERLERFDFARRLSFSRDGDGREPQQ